MTEMTKEEQLKQEAEDFVCSKQSFWKQGRTCVESVRQAYLASAEPREKRIANLEKENAKLKETAIKMNNVITETFSNLTKAKDLIKNIIRVTWGEGWNYSLDWKVKAEQFLSEVEK